MTLKFNVRYKMAAAASSDQMAVVVYVAGTSLTTGVSYGFCALDEVKDYAIHLVKTSVHIACEKDCDPLTDPWLREYVIRVQRYEFTGKKQGFFTNSKYGAVLCRVAPKDKLVYTPSALSYEYNLSVFRAFWPFWVLGRLPSKRGIDILLCAVREQTHEVIKEEKRRIDSTSRKHAKIKYIGVELHGIERFDKW